MIVSLQGNFIVDIDGIQAHGKSFNAFLLRSLSRLTFQGIGAADINKLKTNGFHTIAVSDDFR